MLDRHPMNPPTFGWHGGVFIRCIVWLEACLLHLDQMTCLHLCLLSRWWIAAIPNVASHLPALAGFPLVDRDIFARVLYGRAS